MINNWIIWLRFCDTFITICAYYTQKEQSESLVFLFGHIGPVLVRSEDGEVPGSNPTLA